MITLPKNYPSDVLTFQQLNFLAKKLPCPYAQTGRKAYSNFQLLPGILKVLRTGCRWRDLNTGYSADGSTHWRRLRFWRKKQEALSSVWEYILKGLSLQHKLDCKLLSLDGSLIPSYDFREKVEYSGKHHSLGTKISTLVDGNGIPLAMTLAPGNRHDSVLAEFTIENIHISLAKVQESILLADRGYDSKFFRFFLWQKGIIPNIPKRHMQRNGNEET